MEFIEVFVFICIILVSVLCVVLGWNAHIIWLEYRGLIFPHKYRVKRKRRYHVR